MKNDVMMIVFSLLVKCIIIIILSYGIFSYVTTIFDQQNDMQSLMIIPTFICLMVGVLRVSVSFVDGIFVWGGIVLRFFVKNRAREKPLN